MSNSSANTGGECVTVGSVVAVILSAALNHSFWWGVLHFFFGWLYVIYVVLCRSHEIMPALKAMFS
jgi:hypothetical protein